MHLVILKMRKSFLEKMRFTLEQILLDTRDVVVIVAVHLYQVGQFVKRGWDAVFSDPIISLATVWIILFLIVTFL